MFSVAWKGAGVSSQSRTGIIYGSGTKIHRCGRAAERRFQSKFGVESPPCAPLPSWCSRQVGCQLLNEKHAVNSYEIVFWERWGVTLLGNCLQIDVMVLLIFPIHSNSLNAVNMGCARV